MRALDTGVTHVSFPPAFQSFQDSNLRHNSILGNSLSLSFGSLTHTLSGVALSETAEVVRISQVFTAATECLRKATYRRKHQFQLSCQGFSPGQLRRR